MVCDVFVSFGAGFLNSTIFLVFKRFWTICCFMTMLFWQKINDEKLNLTQLKIDKAVKNTFRTLHVYVLLEYNINLNTEKEVCIR